MHRIVSTVAALALLVFSIAVPAEDDAALPISRDAAVALVRQLADGRVLRAKRHEDRGRIHYQVRILSPDGRVRDFEVDAVTGEVR